MHLVRAKLCFLKLLNKIFDWFNISLVQIIHVLNAHGAWSMLRPALRRWWKMTHPEIRLVCTVSAANGASYPFFTVPKATHIALTNCHWVSVCECLSLDSGVGPASSVVPVTSLPVDSLPCFAHFRSSVKEDRNVSAVLPSVYYTHISKESLGMVMQERKIEFAQRRWPKEQNSRYYSDSSSCRLVPHCMLWTCKVNFITMVKRRCLILQILIYSHVRALTSNV
jgi:hypothetical protein